jgi:chorismate mutase
VSDHFLFASTPDEPDEPDRHAGQPIAPTPANTDTDTDTDTLQRRRVPPRPPAPVPPDPEIPYVHGRDLVPIRTQPRTYENQRHQSLFKREDAARKRIKELDAQVLALAAERRELLHEIRAIHAELRPSYDGARGRRRRAISHEEAHPPPAPDAIPHSGRALRAVCLTLLHQAQRPLTLRELHVLLHRLGYLVAHDHPVKALADALGHEADAGRALRTRRATYQATAPPPHSRRTDPRADPSEPDEPNHRHVGRQVDPAGAQIRHSTAVDPTRGAADTTGVGAADAVHDGEPGDWDDLAIPDW